MEFSKQYVLELFYYLLRRGGVSHVCSILLSFSASTRARSSYGPVGGGAAAAAAPAGLLDEGGGGWWAWWRYAVAAAAAAAVAAR